MPDDKAKEEMKAILRFDLSDEDDEMKWRDCLKATQYSLTLYDFAQWIRKKTKYGEFTEEVTKAFDEVSDEFYRICKEREVDPNA